jgi:hypothetical protein
MHCCERMRLYVELEPAPLIYIDELREYLLPTYDAQPLEQQVGGTGLAIDYCPWCGTKLPLSLRETHGEEYLKRKYGI